MKKLILLVAMLIMVSFGQSQTWDRIGNPLATGQFFGSTNNQAILTRSNNINRMKLNGNLNYTVDGYNTLRDGYLLLGIENNLMDGSGNIYTQSGAFSLLHLNGRGTEVQPYGYRPCMQTGITFTENQDLNYIGLRQVGIDHVNYIQSTD